MREAHSFPTGCAQLPSQTASMLECSGQGGQRKRRTAKTERRMMAEQTSFSALLKRYRQAAGLSQEALAAKAGLSTRAISDLERGIYHAPRYDTLHLLLDALALPEQQQALLRTAARPELVAALEETPPAPSVAAPP